MPACCGGAPPARNAYQVSGARGRGFLTSPAPCAPCTEGDHEGCTSKVIIPVQVTATKVQDIERTCICEYLGHDTSALAPPA